MKYRIKWEEPARYECDTCGFLFDDPAYKMDWPGEFWGHAYREEVACCPSCGAAGFRERRRR